MTEEPLLVFTKIYLEKTHDFLVDTSSSACEAMDKLKNNHYDASVSDYLMPDIDGIAFLKNVRQSFGDIPFILFTGKGREEVVIDAINNDAREDISGLWRQPFTGRVEMSSVLPKLYGIYRY